MDSSPSPETRSAGVTAAAALSLMGSVIALLAWGWFFRGMLAIPPDRFGKPFYAPHPFWFSIVALVPPFLIALSFFTGIGLFQLKPWARRSALIWATAAMSFSSLIIAFRPYETFTIDERFVSDVAALEQLIVIALIIFLLPISAWWLFYFTREHVVRQFEPQSFSSAQSSSSD